MRTDQGVAAFFGRDRPSWGKMARVGARSSPADPELFCRQSEMTFRQRPNGRFLRNLATTRESMSLRNMSEGIFEKFSLKGHLPPKTSKLKGSNRYFTLVVPFRNSIKLLGVTLDSVLTMDRHVTEVIRSCSYHTSRALRHIRPLLTLDVAKMIGHSIVSSRLDYANALLHGTSVYNINRLQVAQNSFVGTVGQAPRPASATELRRQLHWLPVRQRISYKVAVITCKILSTSKPAYLSDLLQDYRPARTLRSSDKLLLTVGPTARMALAFSTKAFSVSAPSVWNSLSYQCRSVELFSSFRRILTRS